LAGLAAAGLTVWFAQHLPGVSRAPETTAVVACAAGVLIAALPRIRWMVLVAAVPALAVVGLATAWPALAGLTGRAHRRATLAAMGGVWAAAWTAALSHPVLKTSTLVTCGIWALAALTLPWTRSRRWPALECVRLATWAIALGVGTLAASHLGGPGPNGSPLLGAFAGALVAFATRQLAARLRGPQAANESPPTS
jgi:hypothetical protein